jgi:DNA-binding MarR family transcriptional regulator
MTASRRTPAPSLSALFDVFVLAQGVKDLLDEALVGAPLRPEEYAVYSQVLATPRTTPTQLAQSLAAPLTTVSDWLAVMRSRGHVERRPSPDDRRSYVVELTASGRRAHAQTNRRFEVAYQAFLAALPLSETDLREALVAAADAASTARRELAADVPVAAGAGQNASAGT